MTLARWMLLALVTLAMLTLMAAAAFAQPGRCGPAGEMIEAVTGEKYAEVPVAKGMAGSLAMTLFANPKTRTWTMLLFMPDGMACLFAAGIEYEPAPPPPPGEPT